MTEECFCQGPKLVNTDNPEFSYSPILSYLLKSVFVFSYKWLVLVYLWNKSKIFKALAVMHLMIGKTDACMNGNCVR